MDNDGSEFAALAIILVGAAIYMIPTIVAAKRNHNNSVSIFMVNLFLGWSLVGWVAALAWACANSASPKASSPLPPEDSDSASKIERLAKLRDSGHLTDEEFASEKKKILSA